MLSPFENFVPIKEDLSDLLEKVIWCQNNDFKVKQIVKNANYLEELILRNLFYAKFSNIFITKIAKT